ncbi:MAG: tyrosine recombinase XerD [Succinivibrio sp.]|nr:tyrosine recombinase XerD [Succinivibrio sp.]
MKTDYKEIFYNYEDYLLLEYSLSDNSIKAYISDVNRFLNFLNDELSLDITEITAENIRCYLEYIYEYKSSSVSRTLTSIKNFCRFLVKEKLLSFDPSCTIESPKLTKLIPHVISESTVDLILAAPDCSTFQGQRDKAMLELVYATGMRVSELVNIKFENVNFQDGFVKIIGKGGKERLVPVCKRALEYLKQYVEGFRVQKDPKSALPYIFISGKCNSNGKICALTRIGFWQRIKKYCSDIGIDSSSVSPHAFRHAFATHLLNHDADLRSVQMMLGHSSLTTTQIYTYVATYRMHQVFDRTHPRN